MFIIEMLISPIMKVQQISLIENNWFEQIESIHIDANLFLLLF